MDRIVGETGHPVSAEMKDGSQRKIMHPSGVTYIVETIIVGISRRGIMSKKNRERSQAVGLG